MIHFFSNYPPHFEKTIFFHKEPFSSDKKSSLESTALLKIYWFSEEGLNLSCFYVFFTGI